MKRRVSRGPLEGSGSAEKSMEQEQDANMIDEALLEASVEELRDFLAADMVGVQADPAFKERLRRELWKLVESQAAQRAASEKPESESDE